MFGGIARRAGSRERGIARVASSVAWQMQLDGARVDELHREFERKMWSISVMGMPLERWQSLRQRMWVCGCGRDRECGGGPRRFEGVASGFLANLRPAFSVGRAGEAMQTTAERWWACFSCVSVRHLLERTELAVWL